MENLVSNERLLNLLQQLIRIKSVNPGLVPSGNGEADIAEWIGSYLADMGLEVKYQELGPARKNVIGVLKGVGGGKSLMLNGHIDTVDTRGMDIDPLDPVYRDGKVYGRGSYDMKGGVAAMIEAVHSVALSGDRLKGDVLVTCVADEEYASAGTEAVVREFSADSAVVCEPTGLDVCVAHKGFAWIKVDVVGKAAHGSLPSEGVDAIMGAAKFLCEVDRYSREILFAKEHPLLGPPSIHGSLIEGGSNLSTYPSHCAVQLERRTIPKETRQSVVDELNAVIAEVKEKDPRFHAVADVFFYRTPFEVAAGEPVVKAVRKALCAELGREPSYCGTAAWLDSSVLQEAGIPTVIVGPDGEGAHSAVEFVDFDSVVKTARTLERVIREIAG